MIVAGASAYSRIIDFPRMAEIARGRGRAVLRGHGAHRGTGRRRACIRARCRTPISFRPRRTRRCAGRAAGWCCARQQCAKELDRITFPGTQGGPLMHIIAAKAVCLKEAAEPGFREYAKQIVANAQKLAAEIAERGLPHRQRRHGQSSLPDRSVFARHHRQGRAAGARSRGHHREQEFDSRSIPRRR